MISLTEYFSYIKDLSLDIEIFEAGSKLDQIVS